MSACHINLGSRFYFQSLHNTPHHPLQVDISADGILTVPNHSDYQRTAIYFIAPYDSDLQRAAICLALATMLNLDYSMCMRAHSIDSSFTHPPDGRLTDRHGLRVPLFYIE